MDDNFKIIRGLTAYIIEYMDEEKEEVCFNDGNRLRLRCGEISFIYNGWQLIAFNDFTTKNLEHDEDFPFYAPDDIVRNANKYLLKLKIEWKLKDKLRKEKVVKI